MKTKLGLLMFLGSLLATACSKDNNQPGPGAGNNEVAYLSIKVATQNSTRASKEEQVAEESDLKTLYFITFNDNGDIVGVPGTTDYFTMVPAATSSPDGFKVSAAATKLLIIANPDQKLQQAIRNINGYSSFLTFNTAITGAEVGEITDDVDAISKGFAMINSGDETGLNAGQSITSPLIPIDTHIKKLENYPSEAAAKTDAENNRVSIKIERLASKVELKVKPQVDLTVEPAGAKFTLENWTLDAVNTQFFPFAEKRILSVTHTPAVSYINNFYTIDPNFSGTLGAGLSFATVDTDTFEPVLPAPYDWMAADKLTYCIENTMDAREQKYGNATRVVIKGKYYPVDTWSGDWFYFAGVNYETFTDLQNAYKAAGPGSNLADACDDMFNQIESYATVNGITLSGADFENIDQSDLDQIPNGGEVVKNGSNPVIRWFQDGLCYYYYQIRHDDVTTMEMEFGKYGVVRNNWYDLTLDKVNGAGTPWFPDINNPGPGDPDPKDPIDESAGYLGVTVVIQPWIVWEREIGI